MQISPCSQLPTTQVLASSVAHFTSELFGGAGQAALRLHSTMCRQNLPSQLYYDLGHTWQSGCAKAFPNQSFLWRNVAALARSWRHRRNAAGGFVTSPHWIRKTPVQGIGKTPDIINLHWVSRWLDLPSFFASLPTEIPVVWSLHDMNPVTGGCHHAGDCQRFTQQCGHCPQLKQPGAKDDAHQFFQTKARLYQHANLHFVGNSEWTTAQVQRSALGRYARSCHTIPLGVDANQFRPVNKQAARQALGLAADRFVVGFACADFNDPNKGGALLAQALGALAGQTPITLLTFGSGKFPPIGNGVEVVELGVLSAPRVQSLFYSAADVFAAPSRIESFGLTALEAMACGTPVVAFRTGGLPDVVIDGETGLLEDHIGSVAGLTEKLRWFLQHPDERQTMGAAARARVETHLTDTLMADRYVKLYQSLLSERKQKQA